MILKPFFKHNDDYFQDLIKLLTEKIYKNEIEFNLRYNVRAFY